MCADHYTNPQREAPYQSPINLMSYYAYAKNYPVFSIRGKRTWQPSGALYIQIFQRTLSKKDPQLFSQTIMGKTQIKQI